MEVHQGKIKNRKHFLDAWMVLMRTARQVMEVMVTCVRTWDHVACMRCMFSVGIDHGCVTLNGPIGLDAAFGETWTGWS